MAFRMRVITRAAAAAPEIAKEQVKLPKLDARLPPYYKLILHKDISFEHKYVSKVISGVIDNMTLAEANDKATEAYLKGKSLLRICPQEIAEDYCEQIRANQVKTTIEPANIF